MCKGNRLCSEHKILFENDTAGNCLIISIGNNLDKMKQRKKILASSFFFVAGCKMEVDLDIIYIETRKK